MPAKKKVVKAPRSLGKTKELADSINASVPVAYADDRLKEFRYSLWHGDITINQFRFAKECLEEGRSLPSLPSPRRMPYMNSLYQYEDTARMAPAVREPLSEINYADIEQRVLAKVWADEPVRASSIREVPPLHIPPVKLPLDVNVKEIAAYRFNTTTWAWEKIEEENELICFEPNDKIRQATLKKTLAATGDAPISTVIVKPLETRDEIQNVRRLWESPLRNYPVQGI